MKIPKFSRRNLLIGGAGLAGFVAIGGVGLFARDIPSLVANVLRLDFPDADIGQEVIDGVAERFMAEEKKIRESAALQLAMRALTGISSIVGYQHLQGLGPVQDRLVVLRRGIVTTFLLTTDYLQLEQPRTSAVSFYGDNPCGNPFAAFDWRDEPGA